MVIGKIWCGADFLEDATLTRWDGPHELGNIYTPSAMLLAESISLVVNGNYTL